MRIPTYRTQIHYQRAYAQEVPLAMPTLQSSMSKDWQNASMIGSAMTNLVQTKEAISAFLDRQSGKRSNPSKPDASEKLKENSQELYSGFSSPRRSQLYQFALQGAWQSTDANETTESTAQQALSNFDNYFLQQIQQADAATLSQNPDHNLWVQDYAVLRQEIQHLQQQQQNQQQQEVFLNGTKQFLSVAGLIRTPKALKQYVQANLQAAEKEFYKEESRAEIWKQQKHQLYEQAVAHNIQLALSCGEIQQAEDIYDFFHSDLSSEQQVTLKEKISAEKTIFQAEELAPNIYEDCVSEEGEINLGKVDQYVQDYCAQKGGDEKCLNAAVFAQLAAQAKNNLQKQAQTYLEVLSTEGDSQKIAKLMASWKGSAEQTKQIEKLAHAINTSSSQSEAEIFNELQNGIYSGHIVQQQIEEAFDKGKLSASDTLRLKSRLCLAKAGQSDPQDKVLFRVAHHLCKRAGLNAQETAEAVYAVFSSQEGAEAHLRNIQELKKWFVL